jgi:hypothetical protein
LRRRPVNCCALASKALSISSVGMCMTMAPIGERDKRACGLANDSAIEVSLPLENAAETSANATYQPRVAHD